MFSGFETEGHGQSGKRHWIIEKNRKWKKQSIYFIDYVKPLIMWIYKESNMKEKITESEITKTIFYLLKVCMRIEATVELGNRANELAIPNERKKCVKLIYCRHSTCFYCECILEAGMEGAKSEFKLARKISMASNNMITLTPIWPKLKAKPLDESEKVKRDDLKIPTYSIIMPSVPIAYDSRWSQ